MLLSNHVTTLAPASPLEYACGVSDACLLMYTPVRNLLFYAPREVLTSTDPAAIAAFIGPPRARYENPVAGYLGYPLKHALERLPHDPPSWIHAPPVLLVRWGGVLVWEAGATTPACYGAPPAPPAAPMPVELRVETLHSTLSTAEYLASVESILNQIRAGEVYQANLTRKFYGTLTHTARPIDLFATLQQISPAPYSAFFEWEGLQILSSSPESFLEVATDHTLQSAPIKGTRPRGATQRDDARERDTLAHSAKDRAENLMIVDLMRHDFSKVCEAGSVHVPHFQDIHSYAQVHHMVSTIAGTLRPGLSAIDAALACFPPGSMTGAPKLRAMEICSAVEGLSRGVYSGALGWFSGDGSASLSVIIRTLLMAEGRFEFQVGGGIVADSVPEEEWAETMTKAAGIAQLLGLTREALYAAAPKHA